MIALDQIRRWKNLPAPFGYDKHPAEGKLFKVVERRETTWVGNYLPDQGMMAVECFLPDAFVESSTELFDPKSEQRERLASVAHDVWSSWVTHLVWEHGNRKDGRIVIPASVAARWAAQASTPYKDLSEAEKESDRRQADKYLAAFDPKFGVSWSES